MREDAQQETGLEVGSGTRVKPGTGSVVFTRNFVLACFSTFFFFISAQMVLPVIPIYATSLGNSQSEIGMLIGAFSLSAIVTRPFIGRLLDGGYGTRLMFFGAGNFAISGVGYNFTTSLGPLLLLRFFHGLGMSAFTTATGWIVSEGAPRHRRGEAVGYFGAATNLSMALGPAMGIALLEATNFSVLFVLSTVLALVAFALSSGIKLQKNAESLRASASSLICRSAIRPSLVLMTLCFTPGVCFTFIPVYVLERGYGNAGLFFTAYAAVSVVFRSVAGRVADKWGRRTVIVPGIVLLVLAVSSLSLELGWWSILAAGAVMGAGFGFAYPGLYALVIDLSGPRERGSATATLFAAFDVGIALGATVSGIVLEFAGFGAAFASAALVGLLGLAYFWLALWRVAKATT